MDTLLVISDEPALAQALADELTECVVVSARVSEGATKFTPDIRLTIAEKTSADSISVPEANNALLTFTRPVRLRELLYTIRERLQAQTPQAGGEVKLAGGYVYSLRERVISSGDGAVHSTLTEKEGELFIKLLGHVNGTLSRDRLLADVWGYSDAVDTHTLETHIYRLRSKLKQVDATYDIASSEEGGYKLCLK